MSDFNAVGPMTSNIITSLISELKKKYNKDKIIKYFIDPIIVDITSRYYSYFLSLILIVIFMVIMLITLVILIVFNK